MHAVPRERKCRRRGLQRLRRLDEVEDGLGGDDDDDDGGAVPAILDLDAFWLWRREEQER